MLGVRIGLAGALLLAAGAHAAALPELWQALLVTPLLIWVPGRGWARQRPGGRWERELAAVWLSLVVLVVVGVAVRAAGLGAWAVLGGMALFGGAGALVPGPRAIPGRHLRLQGLAIALSAVAVWSWRDTLARPLEGYWYDAHVDPGWDGAEVLPVTGGGWRSIYALPGGARAFVPQEDHPYLLGPFAGSALLLLQGPVGANVSVGGLMLEVEGAPTEQAEEGPVPRYHERGVRSALLTVPLVKGQHLPMTLSDPLHSALILIPDVDAVWALHGAGVLRHVHYYQLLNMVEQLTWVRELGHERWVTDVQPPLWSWVLAGPITVTGGGLVTANVLAGWLVVAIALAGIVALRAWTPDAPGPAWLLPAAAAAVHARLVFEPGSADLPDTLYTLAAMSAVGALPRSGAFPGYGLAAQLSRYPGTLLVGLMAVLGADLRSFGRLLGWVGVAAGLVGAAGALTGALPGWIETVRWETGPEHWHDDTDPAQLLGRLPDFYRTWLLYAGGTPLLAALRWPRGTRVALGSALVYSTLLATIDHQPSHYFLPLVQLSALAAGITSGALPKPTHRWTISALGVLGLFITSQYVAITG